jgi:GDPmannose 4,6-dehydratase
MKKALITGILGQDGSYLTEFLYTKGYEIYGIIRPGSTIPLFLKTKIKSSYEIDLTIPGSLSSIIKQIKPNEIYHLAAYHFSSKNNDNGNMPFHHFNSVNILATYEILDSIKNYNPKCRFFYASSCQIFGEPSIFPQNENTNVNPKSLYAISKVAGGQLCNFFRKNYNLFVSVGILFNHESIRRPSSFITTEIAEAASKAHSGIDIKLLIKDINAEVDWGSAKDYVEAMWLTLQHEYGDDYIIATGELHRLSDFADLAFSYINKDYRNYVFQDPKFKNKSKTPYLGDCSKIKKQLGWFPKKSFNSIVEEMVEFHINQSK